MPERKRVARDDAAEAQPMSHDGAADKGGIIQIRDQMRFAPDQQFLGMERGMVDAEVRSLQEEITAWERKHEDDQLEIELDARGVPKERELTPELQRKTRELWRKKELRDRIAEAEEAAKSQDWGKVVEFYQYRRTQLDEELRELQVELDEVSARHRRARVVRDAREVMATGAAVAEVEARIRVVLQRKEEYADRYTQVKVLIEEARKP